MYNKTLACPVINIIIFPHASAMRDVFGVLSILMMSGAVEDTSTNLTISIEII